MSCALAASIMSQQAEERAGHMVKSIANAVPATVSNSPSMNAAKTILKSSYKAICMILTLKLI